MVLSLVSAAVCMSERVKATVVVLRSFGVGRAQHCPVAMCNLPAVWPLTALLAMLRLLRLTLALVVLAAKLLFGVVCLQRELLALFLFARALPCLPEVFLQLLARAAKVWAGTLQLLAVRQLQKMLLLGALLSLLERAHKVVPCALREVRLILPLPVVFV